MYGGGEMGVECYEFFRDSLSDCYCDVDTKEGGTYVLASEYGKLLAEREKLKRMYDIASSDCDTMQAEYKRVKAEREAMRKALQKYGCHQMDCAYDSSTYNDGPWPCTCGFLAIDASLADAGDKA